MDVTRIRARFDLAATKKAQVNDELVQAFEYTNPNAAPNRGNNSLPNRVVCYDNTAEDSAVTLSNMLVGYLVPTDQRWMGLTLTKYADPAKYPVDQINQMLEIETNKFFASIANSNFYMALADGMGNDVRAGTGCICIEINEHGLNYYSVPISELSYLDDGCGVADTVFRDHKVPARSVVEWYGDEVPEKIKRLAKRDPDAEVRLVEAMYPNLDSTTHEDRYVYSCHVGEAWDCCYQKTLGFRNMIVFRWDRTGSLVWGDSPIRRCLPAIRTINMLAKFMLTSGEFASQGAWISNDESLRDQTLIPGTVMFSENPQDLVPVAFAGKFELTQTLLTHYQSEIRAMLFADAMPPASPSARYSAEELQQRQAMFFSKIGTVAHRLDHELLRPIIINTIHALQSVGRMDKLKFGSKTIDLETSDLVLVDTRSLLKRVEANRELQTIIQGVMAVAQVAGPTATAMIDMNGLTRHMLELTGIPASMIKSEKQVQAEQAAMNAVQAMGGIQAASQGQGGNPEMARATGQAVAGLAQTAQQNPQMAQTILSRMPGMGGSQ